MMTATRVAEYPNGKGAAGILAAGIGSLLVAVFAIAADKAPAVKSMMIFWKPTGPLSGLTTCAIVAWLAVWLVLHQLWHRRNVAIGAVSMAAIVLLLLGVALTFPPIADLF